MHNEGAKWYFYTKTRNKKRKPFRAEVLDNNLLQLGRNNALGSLVDTPLLCEVITKKVKKDGQERATKDHFIIRCSLENDLLLTGN